MVKKGYKETEAGVIPEDWDIKSMHQLTSLMTNGFVGTIKTEYVPSGTGVLYLQGFNIKENSFDLTGVTYVSYDFHKKHKKSELRENDLLTVQTGNIGTTAYLPKKFEGANCQALIISRFLESYDSRFWSYYFNSPIGRKALTEIETGSTMKHINVGDMKNIFVPVPSKKEEQQKIAEALSDMDNLVSSLEKLIEKKKTIKQGAMQELLTGKKRLPGFSGTWEEKSISQYGSFVSGNGFPLKFQGNPNGKYPFYKVSDFNNRDNGRIMSKANNYIPSDVADILSCNIVPKDSIIFAKIGAAIALERKKITGCDCCIDNNMMSFQPYQKEGASYICYLFQTIRFNDLVEATALPSLNGKSIGQIRKVFPPTIQEQTAIASILSDMDDEIFALEQKLAKCQKLKQGMMQQLLTGKIRLI